MTALKSN